MFDKSKIVLNRNLPKWPQMRVSGKPITVEQAKEIIRVTDIFFDYPSGNDRATINWVVDALQFPHELEPVGSWSFEVQAEWRERWGISPERSLKSNFVYNDWISCSFIGGPHGWCNPDGTIKFTDNIGKHPHGESVYEDWSLVAECYPFLEIGITLMSGEACEEGTFPVMSFLVDKGKVSVIDPKKKNVLDAFPKIDNTSERDIAEFIRRRQLYRSEFGLPEEWIHEWSTKAHEIFGDEWNAYVQNRIEEEKLKRLLR